MPQAVPTISTPPATPDRSDRTTFAARAVALDDFRRNVHAPQLAAALANVFDNATEALASADAALASADAALASADAALASQNAAALSASLAGSLAGVAAWNAGTAYALGANVFSPVNLFTYRRRVAGTSATEPSIDPVNWALLTISSLPLQIVSGTTQTAGIGVHYALTNAAATTITAPSAPAAGDRFMVTVANGRTDNIVVWGALKHENITDTTMVLNLVRAYEFIYINAAFGWKTL